ncbi:MAG: DUF368 domain-containing protein [Gammaproteobacteria bacterium]|nr:DUF368 domain-containing protein [Gammaproteobacteria bacterium]
MKAQLRIVAIGVLMGIVEIVPGVSGGTVAFISGIYERLINGLKRFTPRLLVELKHRGFKGVWSWLDATFLLMLFGSMGLSVFVFANAVSYLLVNEPIGVRAFFFGLVLASGWVIGRQIEKPDFEIGIAFSAGLAIGLFLVKLAPLELEPSLFTLFLGGMFAVCAWILPGISGSFILLILGLYSVVLEAITTFDILSIVCLACGCVLGLVSFARILSHLFARFRRLTLSVLTGFMLGSLLKLWPWSQTMSYQLNADGSAIPLVEERLLPLNFEMTTGQDADIVMAALAALSGCILVILLESLARRSRKKYSILNAE